MKGKIFVGMGKGIEVELARLRLRLKLDPRLSPLKFCLIVRSLGSHPQMTSLAALVAPKRPLGLWSRRNGRSATVSYLLLVLKAESSNAKKKMNIETSQLKNEFELVK